MTEESLLNKIKECVKREPHCIYLYYTGHSDEQGNWMPDSETSIDLDKILKTLGTFQNSVVIVVDCNYAGNWINQATQIYKKSPRRFHFSNFNLKTLCDEKNQIPWGAARRFFKA